MLVLHRSPRAEWLVEELTELARRPALDPLMPETIVVPSLGLARWLSQELARALSIHANPAFPFPRAFVEQVLAAALGPVPREAATFFEPRSTAFAIARLLPELLVRPEFAPLAARLNGADAARRYEVSRSLADVLDQALVYRPDLILDFESADGSFRSERSSPDAAWWPILWQQLVALGEASAHLPRRLATFRARDDAGELDLAELPRRISLFGLVGMPPCYWDVVERLARQIEVHVFLTTPSPLLFEAVAARRMRWMDVAMRSVERRDFDSAMGVIDGPFWLTSWGRLARESQMVFDLAVSVSEERAQHHVAPTTTLLGAVQSMLSGDPFDPSAIALDDGTFVLHGTHGPYRETAVVYEQIVRALEADPTLEPRDIVVMVPDIEAYAPAVDAVFLGARAEGRPFVPHRVADRGARAARPVVDAFFRALDLLGSRLPAPNVLDLLALDPIRERFEIAAEDVDILRRWVIQSGIRGCADEAHRISVDQPNFAENTWRFGLDRLLLGFTMTGESEGVTFGGTLPYEDLEGSAGELLGRLAEFVDTLERARLRLSSEGSGGWQRPWSVWCEDLLLTLTDLVAANEANTEQMQLLRGSIQDSRQRAGAAEFTEAVPLSVVRRTVEAQLASAPRARGFLEGGVTFCQVTPLRSIPFRMIVLMGLADGAFPRGDPPAQFDLLTRSPRPGDRSRRDDDRHLFLESLMSARDCVLLTYASRSAKDDAPLPPSVLVHEVLDGLADTFGKTYEEIEQALFVQHPLHAFDPRAFDGSDLRRASASEPDRQVAAALVAPHPSDPGPFVNSDLGEPPEPVREVKLDEFVRCLRDPVRAFFQRRLGVYLGREVEQPEPREPLSLDALERWKLGDEALRSALDPAAIAAGIPSAVLMAKARDVAAGRGQLPLGAVGVAAWREIECRALGVIEPALSKRRGLPRRIPIDIVVDDLRIVGEIRDVVGHVRAVAQFGEVKAKHRLDLWIHHVLLATARPGEVPRSCVVGRGGGVTELGPVNDPGTQLSELVNLFRQSHRYPPRFFIEPAWSYVKALAKGGEDVALQRARAGYASAVIGSSSRSTPDAYAVLAFRDIDPLDPSLPLPGPSFPEWARRICGPLFAACNGDDAE